MGAVFSSNTTTSTDSHMPNSPIRTNPDRPNSSSNSSNPTMNFSDPKTPELATNVTPEDGKSIEATSSSIGSQIAQEPVQSTEPTKESGDKVQGEEGEGEDEEEGECGFCLFMKGGGCRDVFIDWENCVKEAEFNEEDVVNKCFEATSALRKCMQAHAEYYEPILRAEKAAEEEAMKELEKEKASKELESNGGQKEEKVVDSKDSKSDNEKCENVQGQLGTDVSH